MKTSRPEDELRIVSSYSASRNFLCILYSFIEDGRQGLTRRPSKAVLIPKSPSDTADQFQAAVPVNQLFLHSPGFAASLPATLWHHTYGSTLSSFWSLMKAGEILQ